MEGSSRRTRSSPQGTLLSGCSWDPGYRSALEYACAGTDLQGFALTVLDYRWKLGAEAEQVKADSPGKLLRLVRRGIRGCLVAVRARLQGPSRRR